MKRITLLLLLFMLTGTVAYSQVPQDFEGGIPPGWTSYNNAFGPSTWTTINSVTTPPIVCEGAVSAYVNGRENIGAGNTSEKWLVSSLVTVPSNGQLLFSTRSTINGFDNTTYQIRVSTVSQNSGFQIVAQWTEAELNQVFNICEEKQVDLVGAGYAEGQQIYIAFVMLVTQPTTSPTGDRWIVDNVRVVERCINPTNIQVTGISQVGATVTWDNPSGADLFEVEIVQFPNTPTGVGVEVGPQTSYTTNTLSPTTQYAVYVRAKCSQSNSEWVGPVNFTTSSPGLTCNSAIPVGGLPYSTTDNTSNYSDDIDGSPGSSGCGATGNFLNGNNVYYSYTADFDGVVNITMTPTGNNSGIFVYNSCANVGVSCIAGSSGNTGTPRVINLPVVNGQTYYIVISTSGTPNTIAYTLDLTVVPCPAPTNLTATGGLTSAVLGWDQNGATSWEYVVQTAGSPIPAGAGIQTNSFQNITVTTLFDGTPIVGSTQYQYWARRDCGDGTFSEWAGPFLFNTTLCEANEQCLYTFRMSDSFGDGWNGALMQVRQNGIVVATIGGNFTSGSGPVDATVSLCTGVPFDLFWNAGGGFAGEVRVQIINPFNQVLYNMNTASAGLVNTVLYSGTVDCLFPACLPPTGVTVSNISDDSAEVSWNPSTGAAQYEVIVLPNGSPAPNAASTGTITSDTTFLIQSLTGATIYNVYVRTICSTPTPSNWTPVTVFNTTICALSEQCSYTFRMRDSFGDGWNGARMQIRQNGIVVATIGETFTAGAGPIDVAVPLCDGLPFDLFWSVGGTFAGEVRIEIINNFDQSVYNMTVASAGLVGTILYTDNLVQCDVPECLPPSGITFTNISDTTAEVSWTPTPGITQYEVIVLPNGSPAPNAASTGTVTSESSFLIENLTASTIYNVYVRAICDGNPSNWTPVSSFNTTICPLSEQCNYTFRMRDSFGDGWNGARMQVRQNGIIVATIGATFTGGAGPIDIVVPLCNGIPFDLFWSVGGTFAGEVRVEIINSFDQTLYNMNVASAGLVNTVLYTGMVDCINPACLPPNNVVVTNVGQEGAQVSWTAIPGFDNYEVFVVPAGSPAPTANDSGTVTSGNTFIIGSLTPSSSYSVYVRTICSETSISPWTTAPVTFITTQIPAELNYIEGFEGTHGWSFVNGTSVNKWAVGTATNNGGTQAMYISNNNGTSNAYTLGSATVVQAYRDIAIPNAVNEATLSFDWRALGESTFDYFRVWIVPTSFNPTQGVQITAAASGGIQLGANFNQNGNYTNQSYILSLAPYAGTTIRLVFEWRNDGGGGTQPPAAIDNINLSLATCPSPIDLLAQTEIGSYSVDLTWTPVGTETQWEVFIQPLGAGAPGPGAVGVIVNQPIYAFLADEDTFYEFYVRAICSDDDVSFWSGPEQFSIFIPPGCASVDVVGVGVDIVDGSVVVCPDSDIEEINLSASFYGIAATTSYAVESIEYAPPFPFTGGTQMPVIRDDTFSQIIDLPFNFCFFGESYSQAQVNSNGVVTFNVPQPVDVEVTPTYVLTQPIPSNQIVQSLRPAIYGVFQDIDHRANISPNANINYQVLGTYPCRALVVNFHDVNQFSCGATTGPQSYQIVIYEISNIIEVYVGRRVPCTSWQSGNGVIGIQNQGGTVAYVPPGRNTGAWTAIEEAWRFVPNGESDVDFQWLMNGQFFSNQEDISIVLTPEQQLELETNLSLTLEMQAVATYATCTPGEEVTTTKNVDIVYIIEFPSNDPVDLESCSATGTAIFDLTQNTPIILGSYNPDLFLITYYESEEDASIPQNPIENPSIFEGTDGQQIWVRVSDLTNTCSLVKSFFLNFGDDIITPIVEFEYDPAVICISSTSGILSPTLDEDEFNFGGEFTATPEGLVIDPLTGEINLGTSIAGIYEVVYALEAEGCTDSGTYATTIELVNAVTPIVVFNYDALEYCKVGDNPVFESDENFDTSGEFTVTPEGLTINSSTGEIDLSTSTAGVYEITYLVSSNTGVCAINESHTVTVTVIDVVDPIFEPITLTYCIGATPDELPTATNGITGTWSPTTIDTSLAVVDAEYIFTPDEGQCANPLTWLVTVTEEVTPTFEPIVTAYCLNATPDALPMTTNGITGMWSPSTIDTSVAVVDAVFVFTPDEGQCAASITWLITVSDEITPTFDPVSVCQDSEAPILPITSLNGITGTWSGVVDTSVAGEFVFTFTPNEEFECAIPVDLSVVVTATVAATFDAFTTTYCQGAIADALPLSNNSVSGTWFPDAIDTSALGEATYIFTPDASVDCPDTTEVVITISTPLVPTFETLTTTYCLNDTPSALPAASENGVNGMWNPLTIDTTAVGPTIYTFTPDSNQCADTVTVEITINDRVVPTFAQVGPLCVGEVSSLPETSQNGIAGTWIPAFSTATAGFTTYTFTPSEGICATTQEMIVEVIARPAVDEFANQTVCAADGAFPLPSLTNGVYYSGPNGTGDLLVGTIPVSNTPQTVYIFAAGTLAGCSSESSFTVTFISVEADELSDVEECTRYFLPEIAVGNVYYTGPGQTGTQLVAGQAVEESQTIYVSQGTPSSCYDETSFEVVINNCGIQKGISPNGDGLNDFFDLTAFDVRTLSIYNRYGKKVYSRGNYSNEWVGQSSGGDELPDGTYYFVIEFNNIEAKTGWIYINRER